MFTIAGERVVARLRKRLYQQIIKQEVGFFDVTKTGNIAQLAQFFTYLTFSSMLTSANTTNIGELTNRLSSDCTVLQNTVTVNISMALRSVGQVIGALAFLFFISWKVRCKLLCLSLH